MPVHTPAMLSIIVTTLILTASVQTEQLPWVKTPLGSVKGYHKSSFDGRTFSAFEGIPYAKPPIGNLRFEEPQPVDPWLGVWNATLLSTCAQIDMVQTNVTTGDEDCLHVNVYVPREHPDPTESLDVIVYIHAGGFMYGSSQTFSTPEIFMDQEVIFVNFNYRLGLIGFLSTEDGVVPGNNGLKDQVQALKWVQKNIDSFGGNPKSVTIHGLSAGSASVHLQYFSPLSKGLFQRGFTQSGFSLNPWSIQEKPLIKTKRLGAFVGCPTDDTKQLVQCLKQRTHQELLSKTRHFFNYLVLPLVPFGPVVEKGASKPFLDQDPYILLKNGQVHDVPLLASNTLHEGWFLVKFFTKTLDFIDANWERLAPIFLEFNDTIAPSSWGSVANKMKEFYFGDEPINQKNLMKLVQLFTDRIFTVGAETSVRMQAPVVKSPVYYYTFEFPGDNNTEKLVGHGIDAVYYFGPVSRPDRPLGPNELVMKNLLVNMLVSFAKTGTPVLRDVEWKPIQHGQLTYMKISGIEPGQIRLETVDELTPRGFWYSLGFEEGENLISKKNEK